MVTSMNIMDNATRKSERQFAGVFYGKRLHHGNHLIHRPSPGLLLTSTTIQSDIWLYRLSPRHAVASLSRITGADSPVIALSSTEAAPYHIAVQNLLTGLYIYNITFFSSVDLTCGFYLSGQRMASWTPLCPFCPPSAHLPGPALPLRLPRQSCRTVR